MTFLLWQIVLNLFKAESETKTFPKQNFAMETSLNVPHVPFLRHKIGANFQLWQCLLSRDIFLFSIVIIEGYFLLFYMPLKLAHND